MKEFVLTPWIFLSLSQRKVVTLECKHCGQAFKEGDRVVVYRVAGRGKPKTKYYHKRCHDSMFIEIEA
jgi:hypothetical protein